MELEVDLIQLHPDDEPDIFYRKLSILPETTIAKEVQRFEKYAWYAKLLKFQLAVLRRPQLNVRLVYNDRYGWHTSSCIRSLRDEQKYINLDKCTCEEDLSRPKKFFEKVEDEIIVRCKLCKRFIPEWEQVAPMTDPEASEPPTTESPREREIERMEAINKKEREKQVWNY